MELAISFGRELQRERVRRKISLASISEFTKVPSRHLQALEDGELEQLPGGVFNKGILRSYCQYLGISEEHWLQRLSAVGLTGPMPEAADLSEFAENMARSRGSSGAGVGVRWWGVVWMLLALGVLCWGAWKYVVRPQLVALPIAAQLVALPMEAQRVALPTEAQTGALARGCYRAYVGRKKIPAHVTLAS